MADLEFFFDPICPWAWITSRWVSEVQQLRSYDVRWRFISLAVINEDLVADWYTPAYRASHVAGLMGLRVADAVRLTGGNAGVARLYTVLGTAFHPGERRREFQDSPVEFMKWVLGEADCDVSLADHVNDESHDDYIRADTALVFERAGSDVGTPVVTFHPGDSNEASFFGPVMSTIPRGDDAIKLWDAIEVIATASGMAELKRSNRSKPIFT